MAGLELDGIDDRIELPVGPALGDIAGNEVWTSAALVRRGPAVGSFHAIAYLLDSGTPVAGATITDIDLVVADVGTGPIGSFSPVYIFQLTCVVCRRDAAGGVRYSLFDFDELFAWIHEDDPGAMGATTNADTLEIGACGSSDYFDGTIGLVGFWDTYLSDIEVDTLRMGEHTAAWWTATTVPPVCLIECNVPADELVDLADNVGPPTVTGTTLNSDEDFGRWTFNGAGILETDYMSFPKHNLKRGGEVAVGDEVVFLEE